MAAVKIQSLQRGHTSRRLASMQHHRAAKTIQAVHRGRMSRHRVSRFPSAATQIQAGTRGFLVRKEFMRTSAVTCIQALARGRIERMKKKNSAAVMIQKVYRGYLARCQVALTRETAVKSCITIQRYFRGYMARNLIAQMHRAAVVVQSRIRGVLDRNRRRRAGKPLFCAKAEL